MKQFQRTGACHGVSMDAYARGVRKHVKHVAQWTAGGHYNGFVDDKSPRAQRNRNQAILLAKLTKEHAHGV